MFFPPKTLLNVTKKIAKDSSRNKKKSYDGPTLGQSSSSENERTQHKNIFCPGCEEQYKEPLQKPGYSASSGNISGTNSILHLKEVSHLSVTCAKLIVLGDALYNLKRKSSYECACAIILFFCHLS